MKLLGLRPQAVPATCSARSRRQFRPADAPPGAAGDRPGGLAETRLPEPETPPDLSTLGDGRAYRGASAGTARHRRLHERRRQRRRRGARPRPAVGYDQTAEAAHDDRTRRIPPYSNLSPPQAGQAGRSNVVIETPKGTATSSSSTRTGASSCSAASCPPGRSSPSTSASSRRPSARTATRWTCWC